MVVAAICIGIVVMIGIAISIPNPERVENGLSQVGAYVTRLANSQAASLSIFTLDGERGFGLDRNGSEISINLFVDRREPLKEQAIRAFFDQRNVVPIQDYLASNGGVRNATRVLSYPLKGEVQEIIAKCDQIMRQIYGITECETLGCTYEEYMSDEMLTCLRATLDKSTTI